LTAREYNAQAYHALGGSNISRLVNVAITANCVRMVWYLFRAIVQLPRVNVLLDTGVNHGITQSLMTIITLLGCAARIVPALSAVCHRVLHGSDTPPRVSVVRNADAVVGAMHHSLPPIAPPMAGYVPLDSHVRDMFVSRLMDGILMGCVAHLIAVT
jgi:hypothetical protein